MQAVPNVFDSFLAAGWSAEERRSSHENRDGSQSTVSEFVLTPPAQLAADASLDVASPSIQLQQRAFGLVDVEDDRELWAERAAFSKAPGAAPALPGEARAGQGGAAVLLNVMGAISACRLATLALRHGRWALAAFHALEISIADLRAAMKHPNGWGKEEVGRTADLKAMLASISAQCLACIDMLADHQPPHPAALDAESVVYITANIDAMYYALLDHHLTCPWRTPVVPPPHVFFPAMLAAVGPPVAAAVEALLTQRAAPHGAAVLREVWGLREDLTLPEDANPLLQVMWAKWQEGALLLFASGIGDNGEMDDVADDEAHFMTWASAKARSLQALPAAIPEFAPAAAPSPQARDTVEDGCLRANCAAAAAAQDANGSAALESAHDDQDACGFDSEEEGGDDAADDGESDHDTRPPRPLPWGPGGGLPGNMAALRAALELDEEGLLDGSDGGFSEELRDGVKPPPPAFPALQAFRDAARPWPCHLYAFAAPTPAALDVLQELAPLVEVGAGVGYWAWLLRRRGVDVVATDCSPTSSATRDAPNQYHGRIPAWTPVERADATAVAPQSDRTLLMCYPPPSDGMALAALRAYRGACVVVVGEWDGDTGDAAFAAELQSRWALVRALDLPNWSDTAHDMTVWVRNKPGEPPALNSWPKCSRSGAAQADVLARYDRGLRRCRYCRSLLFADADTFAEHEAVARQVLALHFIFFKRKLDLDSDVDFETVTIGGSAEEQELSRMTPSEK